MYEIPQQRRQGLYPVVQRICQRNLFKAASQNAKCLQEILAPPTFINRTCSAFNFLLKACECAYLLERDTEACSRVGLQSPGRPRHSSSFRAVPVYIQETVPGVFARLRRHDDVQIKRRDTLHLIAFRHVSSLAGTRLDKQRDHATRAAHCHSPGVSRRSRAVTPGSRSEYSTRIHMI